MKPLSILKVLFLTLLFSSVLVFSLALALYKFGIGSEKIRIGVMAIYGLSGFFGGYIVGKLSIEKKYLWGLVQGLSYVVLLIIFSIIINKGVPADAGLMLLQMIVCVVCSVFGGMLA